MNAETAGPGEGRLDEMAETISEYRTWFIVLGVAMILLGIVALFFPLLTTIAVKVFLGWLILISGVVQAVHAFSTQKWGAFLYNLLIGVLYVLVGAWLAFLPLTGVLTLTFVLAFLFVLQGVLEIGVALRIRPHEGWGWMMAAGVIAVLAGIMLILKLPSSAAWALGLMAGITMISAGWAYLSLALQVGKAGKSIRGTQA